MSFSLVNFFFGLIPLIPITIVIVCFRIAKAYSTRVAFVIWGVCFLIMLVMSLQTYGPRLALRTAPVVPIPEVHQIETGTELIPEREKIRFKPD